MDDINQIEDQIQALHHRFITSKTPELRKYYQDRIEQLQKQAQEISSWKNSRKPTRS